MYMWILCSRPSCIIAVMFVKMPPMFCPALPCPANLP